MAASSVIGSGIGITGPWFLGETEGSFLVAEWHPDPKVLEQEILKMADDFDNWIDPMLEARKIMIEDTERHFRDESDPDGNKWVPLQDHYRDEKAAAGYPDQILVREDHLRPAATSEAAWLIEENRIFFNAGALPPYGGIHQVGSGQDITKYHRILRTAPPTIEGLLSTTPEQQEFIRTHSEGEGSGNNLPARPFIGMSIWAAEAIEQIFLRHLDQTVVEPWSAPIPTDYGPYGKGFGANIHGTFPVISYLPTGQPILHLGRPYGAQFGRMGTWNY